jgi:hypothetical protein
VTVLIGSFLIYGEALGEGPRSLSRAPHEPGFTAGCFTLESDDDCGQHQVTESVLCYDDGGDPGEYCIPFRMIAAETHKCVATQSAGSDRCQLAHDPVCAETILGECVDGSCVYTTTFGPCCHTAELTGMACNASAIADP